MWVSPLFFCMMWCECRSVDRAVFLLNSFTDMLSIGSSERGIFSSFKFYDSIVSAMGCMNQLLMLHSCLLARSLDVRQMTPWLIETTFFSPFLTFFLSFLFSNLTEQASFEVYLFIWKKDGARERKRGWERERKNVSFERTLARICENKKKQIFITFFHGFRHNTSKHTNGVSLALAGWVVNDAC